MRTLIVVAVIAAVAAIGLIAYDLVGEPGPLGSVLNPVQETNPTALSAPTNGAAASSTSQYTYPAGMTAGTYYYRITATDYAGGTTTPSAEFSGTVSGKGGQLVTFTPTAGAYDHQIWIASTSGTYYGYITGATSSTLISTTSTMKAGDWPNVNTAYLFNSGTNMENSWLWSYATADKLVKTGKTFVHTITYSPTDAAATAGYIAILDATAAGNNATTTLYSPPAAAVAPVTIVLDRIHENGLYIDFTTTADVNVSVSYK